MFERDVTTGLLKQLGCISDDGHDRLCTTGNALRGAAAVVDSADGRHVYVGAAESGAVLTFVRDVETGLLTQRGCILQDAPRRGSCTPGKGLGGPIALTLSQDNRTLFAASYASDSIAVFARDASTGNLRWIGCQSEVFEEDEPDGCGHGGPLTSPTEIAVNRAGDRLYVSVESGLTVLDRDPTTGALSVARLSDLCRLLRRRGDEALPARDGHRRCIVGGAQPGRAERLRHVVGERRRRRARARPHDVGAALLETRTPVRPCRLSRAARGRLRRPHDLQPDCAAPAPRAVDELPAALPAAPGSSTSASRGRSCGRSRGGRRWPRRSTQPMRPAASRRPGEYSSSGTAQHRHARVPPHGARSATCPRNVAVVDTADWLARRSVESFAEPPLMVGEQDGA